MERNTSIPIWIKIMSWTVDKILNTPDNIADGHIEKFMFTEGCKNQMRFNQKVNQTIGGYDRIMVHIKDDWFKEIGKWPEAIQ